MALIAKNRTRLLYLNDGDMTVDGNAMNPEYGNETVDVTTFNDAARRNIPGLGLFTVSYTGFYTEGAGRSYSVLTGLLGASSTAAASFFQNGDGSGSLGVGLAAAWVDTDGFQGAPGEAETIDANVVQDGTWDNIISLGSKGSVTASAVTGTYDRGVGATTTAGGVAYLHIFANAASGGNAQWIVRLQSATTATGAYSDEATLTIGNGTTLGTSLSFTGVFNRFVRGSLQRDATSGTLDYQISFAAR